MHEVAIQDSETQKNGLIYLAQSPKKQTSLLEQDRKLDSKALHFVKTALPVRIVGIHHYISNRLYDYVVPILLALFGSSLRHRYRTYSGNDEEYFQAMAAYGITKDVVHRAFGGTSEFDYTLWLRNRRAANL